MGCCTPDIPTPEDPSTAYIQGMEGDLQNSPFVRAVMAASSAGKPVTIDGVTYDFTDLGDADYQAKYNREMAKAALALQQKYGPAIIEERNRELKLSDPEGYQAKMDLFDRIMNRVNSPQAVPEENQRLQDQVLTNLSRGTTLDDQTRREVEQRVRGGLVARGTDLGPAAGYEEAGAVQQAGEAQRDEAQRQAGQFLASGASPEDFTYRQQQQDIADLAAFLSGQSPLAQFSDVSSAGNGAVPFQATAPLPSSQNPTAGVQGIQQAQQIYGIQSQSAQRNVNPYLAGAGLGLQAFGAWKAWGGGTTTKSPTLLDAGAGWGIGSTGLA